MPPLIKPAAFVFLVFAATSAPAIASADPWEGPLPSRPGQTFSGLVRYIGDGDGLCIGNDADPTTWIEVRLSDFDAPELNQTGGRAAHERLRTLVAGRRLHCTAVRGRSGGVIVFDRVIAACTLHGRRLGDLLLEAGGQEGGN